MKKVLKFNKYEAHVLNVQAYKVCLKKKTFLIEFGEMKTRNKIFVQVKAMRT